MATSAAVVILQWVFWAEVCLSACQRAVWCWSAFVMVDCSASQTRTESQVRFPPGLRAGRASRDVWLIQPDGSSAQGTEPLNLPKPCSTYLAPSLYHRVNTSALHTKDTKPQQKKGQILMCDQFSQHTIKATAKFTQVHFNIYFQTSCDCCRLAGFISNMNNDTNTLELFHGCIFQNKQMKTIPNFQGFLSGFQWPPLRLMEELLEIF